MESSIATADAGHSSDLEIVDLGTTPDNGPMPKVEDLVCTQAAASVAADFEKEKEVEEDLVELCPNRFIKRSYIKWSDITNMIVKCTACGKQINHHDSHRFRKHADLGVLICKECYEFYGNGQFSEDEDGEKYCRWCAQGGFVYTCDFCKNVFCSNCLRRNFGRGENRKIQEEEWKCYVCNPDKIKGKVAFCDMIVEYSKQSTKLGKKFNRNFKDSRVFKRHNDAEINVEGANPDNWFPEAFSATDKSSEIFHRRLQKLIAKHATKTKSTKQIVLKLEQLVEDHRSSLKDVMSEVNRRYVDYVRLKIRQSLAANAAQSASEDSDIVTLDKRKCHLSNDCKAKIVQNGGTESEESSVSANLPNGIGCGHNSASSSINCKLSDDQKESLDVRTEPEDKKCKDKKDSVNFSESKESDVKLPKKEIPFADNLSEDSNGLDQLFEKAIASELEDEAGNDAKRESDSAAVLKKCLHDVTSKALSEDNSSSKAKPAGIECVQYEKESKKGSKPLLVHLISSSDHSSDSDFHQTLSSASTSKTKVTNFQKGNTSFAKLKPAPTPVSKSHNSGEEGNSECDAGQISLTSSCETSSSNCSETDAEKQTKKSEKKRKCKKRRKLLFTVGEVEQWKSRGVPNDPKLECDVKVMVDRLNVPVIPSQVYGAESEVKKPDLAFEQLDSELKRLCDLSGLMKKKDRTASKNSDKPQIQSKKKKPGLIGKDSSASDSFSLSSDEEEEKVEDKLSMSKVKSSDGGKCFSDIIKEHLSKKERPVTSSEASSSFDSEDDSKKAKSSKTRDSVKRRLVGSGSNSEDDFELPKKKKKYEKLLNVSLAMSDDDDDEDDDSDGHKKKKKRSKGKTSQKRKRKNVLNSDDSNESKGSSSSSSSSESSSSDEAEKKKKGKRGGGRRRRIKVVKSSDEEDKNDSDVEVLNNSQGTPGKGRKNIRKLISDKKLTEETREAQEAEKERRRRVGERQKQYNRITEDNVAGKEIITKKMVLEVDPESKEEIVQIHPDLVEKLKPHQVNGVKFMWECTIESLKELQTKPGSGCILAHCMGLGKTLQVIAFLHTVLTNKEVRKKIKTAMVICPYNTVLNWSNEFDIWLQDIDDSINVFDMASQKDNYSRRDCLELWHKEGGVLIIGYNIFARLVDGKMSRTSKKVKQAVFELLADPGPDIIVCDEGHMLKNENSALSKAAGKLKSQRRIVLTGTPLQNNLKEYHCMMSFVKPRLLGTSKEFLNRFVNPIINGQYDDSSKHDVKLMKKRVHILHKLLEGCVQRCDYSALTKFLPPKHEFVISVKLSDIQIKLYRHYLDNFRSDRGRLDGGKLFQDYNVLKNIWTYPYLMVLDFVRAERKRMFLDDDNESVGSFINDDSDDKLSSGPECIDENNPQPGPSKERNDSSEDEVVRVYKTRSRGNVEDMEEPQEPAAPGANEWWREYFSEDDKFKIEMSGKMVLVLDILKECESFGDKVLLFSQSILTLDMLELILAHQDEAITNSAEDAARDIIGRWEPGSDYFRMDGTTSVELRKHWIEIFNNKENDRARLFLISTKAGSLGTNLIGANRVIIMDSSWNPSHDVQAIFRVYRFGQIKPVYIYRLLAQGCMEEKIYNRQVTKLSLSCRVVDEQVVDRHFNAAQLSELYTFEPDSLTDRPTPMVPKDRLLADLLIRHSDWIVTYHEHDSLLQSSTEDDLTEEERQTAWTEYENEKEGIYNTASFGPTYSSVYTSVDDMYEGQITLPNVAIAVKTIMEQIKKENPQISHQNMMGKLYDQLQSLKAYYQAAHVKALRYKSEVLSKGQPVPPYLKELLGKMVLAQQQTAQYMNEARKMMFSTQAAPRPATAQQQMPQYTQGAYANVRPMQNPQGATFMGPQGMRMPGAAHVRPVFVDLKTGRMHGQLPPRFKVVNNNFQQPSTSNTQGPKIVEVSASDKDTSIVGGTPIITLVDEPEDQEGGKSQTSSSVTITEID